MNSYYLGFTVGSYRLALRAENLERVLPAAASQSIPYDIPACLGVLIIENEVVPLLSCHALLGLPIKPMHPDDHFLLLKHNFSETKSIKLLIHIEKLLGLLNPGADEIREQQIPKGSELVTVRSLKSQWGLLTLFAQDELLSGIAIEELTGLIEQYSLS